MKTRPLWLLLALLGPSGCIVPGLEIGPGQDENAGASVGGTIGTSAGGTETASAGGTGGASTGGAAGAVSAGGMAGDSGTTASGGTLSQAGAGGSAAVEVRCEDFPIPPKAQWTAIASSTSLGVNPTDPLYNPASNAIDGLMTDRWASGQPQASEGQWFHIDFGTTVAVSEVTLEQGTNLQDYPRGYEISLSYRHTDFDAEASAKGQGASVSETVIPLQKRSVGRYMLIRQTGTAERWWSIAEVNVACH